MKWPLSRDRLRFLMRRIRERLWIKPLLICIASAIAVFCAKVSDELPLARLVPDVSSDSLENLLSIMAGSMLAIATFAVASMVSAYSSASTTATPRSFPLVISDDVSQNALSTFVGAFIFSVVALMVMKNGYFEIAGRFTLFSMTVAVLGFVVFTFVRWTDRIARLGRLGATVEQVEMATSAALRRRRKQPALGGVTRTTQDLTAGVAVFSTDVGYVQQIDMQALQEFAQGIGGRVVVSALPGTFAMPGSPLDLCFPVALCRRRTSDRWSLHSPLAVTAFSIMTRGWDSSFSPRSRAVHCPPQSMTQERPSALWARWCVCSRYGQSRVKPSRQSRSSLIGWRRHCCSWTIFLTTHLQPSPAMAQEWWKWAFGCKRRCGP